MSLDEVDLNKLATFFAVAEAGGVSAAARRLGVTRSAVSQSLAAFEASLALQLFHLGLEVANRTERPRWDPRSYSAIVRPGITRP